jgi:hypothetical protein
MRGLVVAREPEWKVGFGTQQSTGQAVPRQVLAEADMRFLWKFGQPAKICFAEELRIVC